MEIAKTEQIRELVVTPDEVTGVVEVPGGLSSFRRIGGGRGLPLLVLHGGPGSGSGYLRSLEDLAVDREVIFWDQLGSPGTVHSGDPALWTMDRAVAEVTAVRRGLGLDRLHLLCHSWGGWLGIEFLLGRPGGVGSVVLADTSAGVPQFAAAVAELRTFLPQQVRAVLDDYEAADDLRNPDYLEALAVYYERHVHRHPAGARALVRAQLDLPAFNAMQGPNELVVRGNLAGWDRHERLGEVRVPALVINGTSDHMPPHLGQAIADAMPNAVFQEFHHSAHSPFHEERHLFMKTVNVFLTANDPKEPQR